MSLWRLLIGRPLKVTEAAEEEIGAPEGLAALSLDALSSIAYGPQAMLLVLAPAGVAALGLVMPLTWTIVLLLAILVFSYSQVIEAYPEGGGAYAVSKDNLGPAAGRLAGAALIVDYTLTVAVSIAAGVAMLTSAFPALLPWTVPLDLTLLLLLTGINLRGSAESGRAFLPPTLVFIVSVTVVLALGLLHALSGAPAVIHPAHPAAAAAAPAAGAVGTVGILLLLRAFASGCSALTGVEAIANGVPMFAPPRVRRAKTTEFLLGAILGVQLLGVSYLSLHYHADPALAQTVLSQVAAAVVGRGWLYYVVTLSTTAVLALAANTSYGGLPILASILARDDYLPHIFALRGDRLVYNSGILVLTALAAVLLVVANGNTNALIPLFAIGVFTGFTLSQTGMVRHWLRRRPPGYVLRAGVNGLGAVLSGGATLVFILTKFAEGAWIVTIAIPLLYVLFVRIHAYYRNLERVLRTGQTPPRPIRRSTLAVVALPGVSRLATLALSDARSLASDVLAVTVVQDPETAERIEREWEAWDPGVRLVTLTSQHTSIVRPLLRFIRSLEVRAQGRVLVLIPEVIPRRPWQRLLHNRIGVMLAAHLRAQRNVIVAMLPVHVHDPAEAAHPAGHAAGARRR